MSKTSPNKEYVEEKRKLLYWIAKWPADEGHLENINVDISELTVLLQSIGFRLETLEKASDVDKVPISKPPTPAENNTLHLELICATSGMKSTLIKHVSSCKCPSEEQAAEGQFWSVTGCGPSNKSSVTSSNSSLLPSISAAKSKIINHLIAKIFSIINDTDINYNEKLKESFETNPFLTRHRSLDTLRSGENANPFPPIGLRRLPSWEVDPKTSPPTGTSSPLTGLSSSFSQISLDSNKSSVLMKNLQSIRKLVTDTMEIAAGKNATFVKTNNIQKKRVSDVKPMEGPYVSDLINVGTPPHGEQNTPRKKLTPKKLLGSTGERKMLPGTSRIATLRKKTLLSTSPGLPKSPMMNTSQTKSKLTKQSTASSENIFKSRISTNIGIRKKVLHNAGDSQSGASGIAKMRTAGKRTVTSTTSSAKKE